jgi:hypothetical protein
MNDNSAFFPILTLPSRYETLEEESQKAQCDLSNIVRRVDTAALEIEALLREVQIAQLGRFEVFFGLSGSGKTTFLKSLPYFFENIKVVEIKKTIPLTDVVTFIDKDNVYSNTNRLYVIHDRDNPREQEKDIRHFFDDLRSFFRTSKGKILVIWPITKRKIAEHVANIAWDIGRDSLLGTREKLFEFKGLPRETYYEVGDITSRALNNGEGLESFGISPSVAHRYVRESDTIGEFYSKLNAEAARRNAHTLSFLKERIRPRIWIVVPGDDLKELDRTVKTLTQGTRSRVDIDRLCEFLDDDSNKSAYLTDWRNRRSDMAYLMRFFDVRLFELPPNAALAAVRTYGDDAQKTGLKKKGEREETCIETFGRIRLGQALLDPDSGSNPRIRETSKEMAEEFMVIQQLAAKGDAGLNKSVGLAIHSFLVANDKDGVISAETKDLAGSQLRPDIQIGMNDGSVACVELTWRSTGALLPEREGRKAQNTLTPGHIQKYLLEKVMEYVKDYKL